MDGKIETQNTVNPGDYFLEGDQVESPNKMKARALWQKALYYLRQIWPYVYNFINSIVYWSIKIGKGVIHMALEQVRKG